MHKDTREIGSEIVNFITHETQNRITKLNRGEGIALPEAVFVAAMGSMGSLQILAAMIGRAKGKSKFICDNINPVATLFAGILAAKMGSSASQDENDPSIVKLAVPFGPTVLIETLEACERFLGRAIDDDLNENFATFLREAQKRENEKFGASPVLTSMAQ